MGAAAVKLAELEYSLRTAVHRLGRAGGLGVALAAGAAAFYFSAVRPAQDELAALEARARQTEKRGVAAAPLVAATDEMERFIGFFPGLESTPAWLRTVYAVADREKLELLQGSYKLSEDPVLGLAYYRILLPVRGHYPRIRRFIAGVLDEAPALSLEGIVFQREKVGDGAVEAKISLTLHLQAGRGAVLVSGAR